MSTQVRVISLAVANTGAEDVVMVFGFPYSDYPPTERRPSQERS